MKLTAANAILRSAHITGTSVIVYLRGAGEVQILLVQRSETHYVLPHVGQLASLFEPERAKVKAAIEGIISDIPDALRNGYSCEPSSTEAAFSDGLQL